MPTASFLIDRWDDSWADRLSPLDRLIYRSNLLGIEPTVTNTGGGNTSAKLTETDPLTGEDAQVLWVKGSGGDLRTATAESFSSLYLDKLRALEGVYQRRPDRGPKQPGEDALVPLYAQTTFNLNPRAPSIDTPLHALLPARHIDHVHPNAVIALATCERSEVLTREVFGDVLGFVPWIRPGFELGVAMRDRARAQPEAHGLVMGQHGLIAWADEDRGCYRQTLSLVRQAAKFIDARYEAGGGDAAAFGGPACAALDPAARRGAFCQLIPWLRGQLSGAGRMIATVDDSADVLRFVCAREGRRLAGLGTSCPDHFLRTKVTPLWVPWDPSEGLPAQRAKVGEGLEAYRESYAAYYRRHCQPGSPPMRDPNPAVILIPGVGMITWGKNKLESRMAAEFYRCALEVMRGAEAIDRYCALDSREAFDVEYWSLEEAKLRRMPPEAELARRIVVVVGAGSGIGRETAIRLAGQGAQVVCADVNSLAADTTANEIERRNGSAVSVPVDITLRTSVSAMLATAVLAYGGVDDVCVTAGIFVPSDTAGRIPDEMWATTFGVNITGSYLVADEAARIWKEQGLTGSLVLTTSANAVVAKRGSLAYDVSKAAANHLVRELAIELAPLIRVNGVAPATVVPGSAMFSRERVIGSLAKYGIDYSPDESDEALTAKLGQFYAHRTLTKRPITPADQAEAYLLLVGPRLSKTTGQVIAVDGGLVEAFLR